MAPADQRQLSRCLDFVKINSWDPKSRDRTTSNAYYRNVGQFEVTFYKQKGMERGSF